MLSLWERGKRGRSLRREREREEGRERETDRQTNSKRQTDRQRDRQIEREEYTKTQVRGECYMYVHCICLAHLR